MTRGRQVHHRSTRVLSVVMILIGVALLVRTFASGGGPLAIGVLLGVLFVGLGAGRLFLSTRIR